ncbi:MAG: hypothetical protein WAL67_02615 [Candidatus Cybelea sp.]
MPLQIGTWKTNVGGTVGQLVIETVDAQGNVSGTLTGLPGLGLSMHFGGYWEEESQRITFLLDTSQNQGFAMESFVFTGYLFQDSLPLADVTGSTIFTLAGSFSGFFVASVYGITALKSQSGWYGQIGVE